MAAHMAQVERFITLCDKLGCFVVIDDFSFDSSVLTLLRSKALRLVKIVDSAMIRDEYEIPGNWAVKVEDGEACFHCWHCGWTGAIRDEAFRGRRAVGQAARHQQDDFGGARRRLRLGIFP